MRSPNSSTQLRRSRTSSTVYPPVPTTYCVADPNQSADSEQMRRLHSTQSRKIREIFRNPRSLKSQHSNSLRVSHLLMWADLYFCHSCYSFIRAANGPNSAVSLKQTFNRILYRFCNRQYFGLQKEKTGIGEQSCTVQRKPYLRQRGAFLITGWVLYNWHLQFHPHLSTILR